MNNLGQRIAALRAARGYTLEQLADRSSVSPSFIAKLEKGACSASLSKLVEIANGLNIPFSSIMGISIDAIDTSVKEIADTARELTTAQLVFVCHAIDLFLQEKK